MHAQARAAGAELGREERVEDAAPHGFVHALSVVADAEFHLLPVCRHAAHHDAAFGTAFLDQASKKVPADKFDTLRKAVADTNAANLTSLHSAIRTALEAYQKVKMDNDGLGKDIDSEKARLDKYTKEAENPAIKRNRSMSAQAQEKVKVAKDNYGRIEEAKKKSDTDLGTATDAFNAAKDAYLKALGTSQPAIDSFKSAAGF